MEELDLRRILSANIKLYRHRREWSQIKVYNDMTISLEQSVGQTMKKSLENVFKQYLSQI
jgi:hypothetical protein